MKQQFSIGPGNANSSRAFGNDSIVNTESFAQINSTYLPPVLAYQLAKFDANLAFHYRATDMGAGQCSITTLLAPGGAPAFTRATAAWTRTGAGDSWVRVLAGVPRAYYNAAGVFLGLLRENAATAYGTTVRDLTNAAWVKAGAPVVAKDGAGIDSVANSCSTITAGAAGDTVLQTYASAVLNWVFQPFIKRITGTGTVEITIDGGANWKNVTAELVTGYHVQCSTYMNAANPQFGFRLGTAGDKISVDFAEIVSGRYFPTSPIGGAATTRNQDLMNWGAGSWVDTGSLTLYAEGSTRSYMHDSATNALEDLAVVAAGVSNTPLISVSIKNGAEFGNTDTARAVMLQGGTQAAVLLAQQMEFNTLYKVAGAFSTDYANCAVEGSIGVPDTLATWPVGLNTVRTGLFGTYKSGTLLEIKAWNVKLPDTLSRGLTGL